MTELNIELESLHPFKCLVGPDLRWPLVGGELLDTGCFLNLSQGATAQSSVETKSLNMFTSPGNPTGAQLPQNASDSEKRERTETLKKAREIYKYATPETVAGIPFVEKTFRMKLERPRIAWLLKVFWVFLKVFRNFARHNMGVALRKLLNRVAGLFSGSLNLGQDRHDALRATSWRTVFSHDYE